MRHDWIELELGLSLEQPPHRLDDRALLLRDARQGLLLVHGARIPLGSKRIVEPRLVLRDRGVRVRQIGHLECSSLAIFLLGDDDVGELGVFPVSGFDACFLLEELGIGCAFLGSFAAP